MKLEFKLFGKVLKEIYLEPEREYFLGRSSECDIVLQEEANLSRKHLCIYQQAGSKNWNIKALTEKSELYLNGEEVSHFEIQNSCFFNLKNYVLSFVEEDSTNKVLVNEELEQEELEQEKKPTDKFETDMGLSTAEGGTQIIPVTHLLYCLRISIEGEFSDYINLNLGEKWTIGRSEDCDISINYDLLTRQHVEIEKKQGQFYVKDLGSTNKTYLNDSALSPNKSVLLNVDDEISVSDLRIVFEIRDTNYENKLQNLPAKTLEEESDLPDIVTPKLVLEDFIEEESENKSFQKNIRKKLSFFGVLFLLLGLGAYLFYEDMKNKNQKASNTKEIENKDIEHRILYEMAQKNQKNGNYFECISNVEELHQKVSVGFYEDSIQIQIACQTGLNIRKQKQVEEEAKKRMLETEAKKKKLEEDFIDQYNKGLIKTESDVEEYSRELLDLDPTNEKVSQIKMEIEAVELQKKMALEKKDQYRKWLQSKRSLYYRAKKINREKEALRAVKAYDKFLKSARGVAGLKTLYQTAEKERSSIQDDYDSTLKTLRDSCAALTENRKFKEAYPSCKRVLEFKNHDQVTLDYIKAIKRELTLELKPIYEEAQWHENFSRIEPEALKIWQFILNQDIEGGYYYKKAQAQIKKYKKYE